MKADELRRRRLALKWTEEELARHLGVDQELVKLWETSAIPITESRVASLNRVLKKFEGRSKSEEQSKKVTTPATRKGKEPQR